MTPNILEFRISCQDGVIDGGSLVYGNNDYIPLIHKITCSIMRMSAVGAGPLDSWGLASPLIPPSSKASSFLPHFRAALATSDAAGADGYNMSPLCWEHFQTENAKSLLNERLVQVTFWGQIICSMILRESWNAHGTTEECSLRSILACDHALEHAITMRLVVGE